MTLRQSAIAVPLSVALAISATAAGARETPSSASEPYMMVRSLQALQDGIAKGSMKAHGSHLPFIKQIGERFVAAPPDIWGNPQNGQALLIYLLSGGAPQVVRKLPRARLNVDDRLFNGALAYAEGRQDEARELLKDVDPRTLPSGLAGQVALVQGGLLSVSDPKGAIARFDDARLLLPGTLVEEAALRREIVLVGQTEDFDKFEALAAAYVRLYRDSLYAGDFWQRFSLALTRTGFALEEHRFERVAAVLHALEPVGRFKVYLAVARTALVRGRPAIARLACDRALPLSADAGPDRERLHLVRGTARALTGDHDGGLAEMKSVERSKLPERDMALFDAALRLVIDIRKPFAGLQTASDKDMPPTPARLDLASSTAALATAQRQLGELDLLKGDRRP